MQISWAKGLDKSDPRILKRSQKTHQTNLFNGHYKKLGKINSRKLKEFYKTHQSPFKGKKHTEKTKNIISEKCKGYKHTPEAIKKISKSSKGRKKTPEEILKIKNAAINQWKNISKEEKARITEKISSKKRGKKLNLSKETRELKRQKSRLQLQNNPEHMRKFILAGQKHKPFANTKIEQITEKILQTKNIPYVKQKIFYTLYDDIQVRMIADFVVEDKFVIECDGDYWHSSSEAKERDRLKNYCWNQMGYKVIRLRESTIHKNINKVEKILSKIQMVTIQ